MLAPAPIAEGEALLADEAEDGAFTRAELTDVVDDWLDSRPGDEIFALVHPADFAQLAPQRH